MKRILHIVGNMNMGGQETFIMNVYRQIDRTKVQFDFVVHSLERGYYDDEIEKLGGKIYRITPMTSNLLKHMRELYNILKQNNQYIVHRHTCSSIIVPDLLVAKCAKIKKIIVHCHATQASTHQKLNALLRRLMNKLADEKLACSSEAGEFLYGRNINFKIIKNAIDVEKYEFNNQIRKKIREYYNANDKFIIGHVGRFDKAKNHEFIIDIIEELVKENKNIELWLVGDGELRKKIEEIIKEKNILNYVKIMGIKDNINELMMGMDLFLFPSIYEGLGIALIEAQCTGLYCIVSDAISQEAIITNKVKKIGLNENKEIWKEEILSNLNNNLDNRCINFNDERIKKYNLQDLIEQIYKIYDVK